MAASLGADEVSVLALSLLPTIPGATVRAEAALTWRVENWQGSSGGIRSPHFMCGGTKWRLLCHPQGSPAARSQNSVSIYIDRGDFGHNTNLPPVCVQFSFVISHPYNFTNYVGQTMAKRIGLGEVLCGFDTFCTSDQVLRGAYGTPIPIISQGEADITVYLRVMNDPTGELWMDGVPTAGPTASSSNNEPSTSSQPTSSTSTSTAPKTEKPLPPTRAAYPGEECMICADEPLLFPAKPPTALCSHEARICLPCLQGHIASEFQNNGAIDGFVCPAPDCTETLDYREIEYWSDESTFIKYDRALMKRALGVDDNFVLCSNTACESGQIHSEGAEAPIVTCYVCFHRTCFTHQIAWHEGYTCDEWDLYQKSRAGIATTAEYLSKFTKKCPSCDKSIEKDAGCDKMTCKLPAGCGHAFCWLCLAPYADILRDGNHRHRPSCKYYAPYDEPVSSATLTPAYTPYTYTPPTSASTYAYSPPASTSTYAYNPPASTSATTTPAFSSFPLTTASALPYIAPPVASTSHHGKKWYKFWKDR